jgi:hypothetical protein
MRLGLYAVVTVCGISAPVFAQNVSSNFEAYSRQPFKALGLKVKKLKSENRLDLQSAFEIRGTAKLDKNGLLEEDSLKYTVVAGNDPQIISIVKDSIDALRESGLLMYVRSLGEANIEFSVGQDQKTFFSNVSFQFDRDAKAASTATALNLGVSLATTKNEMKIEELRNTTGSDSILEGRHRKDELNLLQNTRITATGNKLFVGFEMGKDSFYKIIETALSELADQK